MKQPKKLEDKYRRLYNLDVTKMRAEKNVGSSQTIQGETHSIKDLMKRAAVQGHLPVEEKRYGYLDVEDIEKIDRFFSTDIDFSDLQELRQRTIQLQEDIKQIEAKRQQENLLKEEQNKASVDDGAFPQGASAANTERKVQESTEANNRSESK